MNTKALKKDNAFVIFPQREIPFLVKGRRDARKISPYQLIS
jgi:hypothetical protein